MGDLKWMTNVKRARPAGRHKLRQQWCPLIVFDWIQSSCLWSSFCWETSIRLWLRLAGRTLLCITMARQTIIRHWLLCWQQVNKPPLIGHTCKSMEVRGEKSGPTRALTKETRQLTSPSPIARPARTRPRCAGSAHPCERLPAQRNHAQSHERFASNHPNWSKKRAPQCTPRGIW